jgi:peptidoglycan hydrolase-like protein with peptidoglycan-binding domain
MSPRALVVTAVVLLALASPSGAFAGRGVAALQVALQARGLYGGTIDGIRGPGTVRAVQRFQRRHGLVADGVVGPRTRRALGRYARHRFGSRLLRRGRAGWDVAALQFALATHGFPCGTFDGGFGPRTAAALRRFQRRSHLVRDGVAGPATYAALNRPRPRAPYALSRPIRAPLGDLFGPRGNRFHAGVDFPAPYGRAVRAAAAGRVVRTGWHSGGYGYRVRVAHRGGVHTLYAHLSRITVRRGQRVSAGTRIGKVGSSGASTGPHLHFEVRLRRAAVNPLPALR